MHVLSVAYPFAAVSRDAVGGAEQVLATLDAALVGRGHRSTVVACEGSRLAGELIPVPAVRGTIGNPEHEAVQGAVRSALAKATRGVDLVHLHGLDFPAYLPPSGPPALATLHLPPAWYDPTALRPTRPRTYVHCVSPAQQAACPPSPFLLPPIANGVPVAALGAHRHARRGFAVMLGRIAPEKGQHIALAACRRAGVPLLLAGALYEYPEHRAYFEQQVRPQLDAARRWIGPIGFARKRRLLSAARCLLVPSLASETSSLVAMEAAACGTPVVALRAGALPDIVQHGTTGYVVGDEAEMAGAIRHVHAIDPAACRARAAVLFDEVRMVEAYLALYRRLIAADADR